MWSANVLLFKFKRKLSPCLLQSANFTINKLDTNAETQRQTEADKKKEKDRQEELPFQIDFVIQWQTVVVMYKADICKLHVKRMSVMMKYQNVATSYVPVYFSTLVLTQPQKGR